MLEICDLHVNLKKRPILQNVHCSMEHPSLTYLVGPNGSGKTTFLKSLAGLAACTGSILWEGRDLATLTRREQSQIIALVPQAQMFHFPFTVAEAIAMGMFAQTGISQLDHTAEEIMEKLHLFHLRNRLITEISAGERQKVLIARGLVAKSSILLLDEPTASLDPQQKAEIWVLIKEIGREKTTVVATHDIEHVDGPVIAFQNGSAQLLSKPFSLHELFLIR